MPQDKIIEAAIKYGVQDGIYVTFDLTHDGSLLRFAKLIQAQPPPSQSVDEEDVVFPILSGGIFKHEKLGELYDRLQVHSYAVKHCQYFVDSLTKPQPTSQEYCCVDSWENAKEKAWNNRDFKLCKCDINESCSHCYPSDFKDGGKWALCKPMKASK